MLYAAYGSNLHPLRLGERLESARLLGTGVVAGWGLKFHKRSVDGSGKCSIHPGGGGVHVAIYEITPGDKLALDRIEGLGRGYDAMTLDVPEFGECATYAAQPTHVDESLVPYEWYRELVRLGAEALRFPADYRRTILDVDATPDPDAQRAARAWQLVRTIRGSGA